MKKFAMVLALLGIGSTLTACGSDEVPYGEVGTLKFNMAFDSSDRTMTYNYSSSLRIDGYKTITSGQLKPVWQELEKAMDAPFSDVTNQQHSASQMMTQAAITQFSNANIYGGNGIAEQFMSYGTDGLFVNLNDYMDKLPNFSAFLDDNADIKSSITAYDGGIYHIPYISEIGEVARTYNLRTPWVDLLLSGEANYDTTYNNSTQAAITAMGTYEPYFDGSTTARTRATVVYPTGTTGVKKATTQNIIEIQNNLTTKNATTLTEALITYIDDNYVTNNASYTSASDLYVGANAAYDMDELVALLRCVKANPKLLSASSGGTSYQANDVYPFFVRQSSYREDLLRFATYFNGARLYGSDSYSSTWEFDENGQIQYTYTQKDTYEALTYISNMFSEGLIYSDALDTSNDKNFRYNLYGTDGTSGAQYGFMSYDWIASSTAETLNKAGEVEVVLPPVAYINGDWQYYIDNSRTIKPDGWAISTNGSNPAQIDKSLELFDYMFSEEGSKLQNYGIDEMLETNSTTINGIECPEFTQQVHDLAGSLCNGDLSTFLRDYVGALMAIGFQKEIGFEYQYTSEIGFDGINMLNNSNVNFPTYEGVVKDQNGNSYTGGNANYYKLVPAQFSLTSRQQAAAVAPDDTVMETLFNVVKSSSGSPKSYDEYYAVFAAKNIETYIAAYQQAYTTMLAVQGKND